MNCRVHPDAISYSSIVVSGMAGACFWQASRWPWLLLVGPAFCCLRLWLNMLDGMVALGSGKASLRGEVLNDLPDRVSDVLIFTGVAYSGLCRPAAGYWPAIASLLTAYVGVLGQAVGAGRQFGGIMSKPWRMLALGIGAWVTLGLIWLRGGRAQLGPMTALEWTALVIVAGCIQTITVRLRRILSMLSARQERGPA